MTKLNFIDMINEQIRTLQAMGDDVENRITAIKNRNYEAVDKRWIELEERIDFKRITQLQYKKCEIQSNIFALQQAIDIYIFSQKTFNNEMDYKNKKSELEYNYIQSIKRSV